jgi:hypothetical protein
LIAVAHGQDFAIASARPFQSTGLRAGLACLTLLAFASIATASTKSWTGAVSGLWSVGGNWNGGVAPVNGDSVVFPSGPGNFGLMTNDLSGLSLQSVSFTGGGYNLAGNSVVIAGGGQALTTCCSNIVLNLPIVVGASETFSANGEVTFSNSIDLNGQTLRLAPYITKVTGSIVGSGGFVLDPGGGLNLTGTSSFTGTFTVSPSASVNVAGSISNSSLAVGAGGRLSGAGTVPATSLADATLSAGNDSGAGCCADPQTTGILSTGDLSIQAGTVLIDIRSTTPGTGYDQIKTTGTVTLTNPTLQVVLPGLLPAPGQSFTIIDNDGSDPVVGTFNGLPEGATFTASGVPFRITYVGGTGNDVVLTAFPTVDLVAVPTLGPAAIVLLAIGLVAIGARLLCD